MFGMVHSYLSSSRIWLTDLVGCSGHDVWNAYGVIHLESLRHPRLGGVRNPLRAHLYPCNDAEETQYARVGLHVWHRQLRCALAGVIGMLVFVEIRGAESWMGVPIRVYL